MDLRAFLFPSNPATAASSGEQDPNYRFYRNELSSQPDGDFCDAIHEKWDGNYNRLEMHHGYIQWLFPVFENAGMNFESSPLSKEGAALIRADPDCCKRVIKSYRMMLRFYGLVLADERTGQLERDATPEERLDNLNYSAHNWLRVSRIITSLGELGFRRYKAPLIQRLQLEVGNGTLSNAAGSCANFWAPLVTGEAEEWYARKTREVASDREECCLFQPGGELAGQPPVAEQAEAAGQSPAAEQAEAAGQPPAAEQAEAAGQPPAAEQAVATEIN